MSVRTETTGNQSICFLNLDNVVGPADKPIATTRDDIVTVRIQSYGGGSVIPFINKKSLVLDIEINPR